MCLPGVDQLAMTNGPKRKVRRRKCRCWCLVTLGKCLLALLQSLYALVRCVWVRFPLFDPLDVSGSRGDFFGLRGCLRMRLDEMRASLVVCSSAGPCLLFLDVPRRVCRRGCSMRVGSSRAAVVVFHRLAFGGADSGLKIF